MNSEAAFKNEDSYPSRLSRHHVGHQLAAVESGARLFAAIIVRGHPDADRRALLVIVALPRIHKLRLKETWPIYLVSALLNITLFYGLQTIGLNYLPAGLFSAIVFFQPVLMGVFSWLWLGESMFALKVIGLILGFAGVAVISAAGFGGHISVIGVLLALGSALSWALGTIYMKKQATASIPSGWSLCG